MHIKKVKINTDNGLCHINNADNGLCKLLLLPKVFCLTHCLRMVIKMA